MADYTQRGGPIRVSIVDDRLGVENPGLLAFGRTVEDLQHGIPLGGTDQTIVDALSDRGGRLTSDYRLAQS
ncbi:MAG: hypothetical protein ACRENI_10020 [Gemmatimonadaceae bacterium]